MVTALKAVQVLKTPFHTLQVIWKRRYSLLIFLTLLLKLICVNLNNIYPPPTVARATVTYDPLSLFDPSSSTFRVLDRSNVSFLIEPVQRKACPPNSSLLLFYLCTHTLKYTYTIIQSHTHTHTYTYTHTHLHTYTF